MTMYNVECSATNCVNNNKYRQECDKDGLMLIDRDGKCKHFKAYDYVGEMRKSLQSAILQSRVPTTAWCELRKCLRPADDCVKCPNFLLWSLIDNQITIKCGLDKATKDINME